MHVFKHSKLKNPARRRCGICFGLSLIALSVLLVLSMGTAASINAADKSVREIVETLHQVQDGVRPDFTGLDLSFLDLSGIDFKAAKLSGSILHAADLTGANLAKADLTESVLDRATIVRADFSGADLANAKIRLPHSAGSPGFDSASTPRFANANLRSARLVGRFDGADLRNANLTEANLGPYGDWTQNTMSRRSVMIAADFSGAVLRRANLVESVLRFANFKDADLSHADLSRADLTGAKLLGADLTGANLSGANLENVDLSAVKGLHQIVGIGAARNVGKSK